MKNVLHLIDTFGTGGAESVYLQLLSRLDANRFRSFPALLGKGWLRDAVAAAGHVPIDMQTAGSMDIAYLRQLAAVVRRLKIDVIQTHLLTTAVYGGVVGLLTGVPVVSTFHGLNDVQGRLLRPKAAAIGVGAARVVFVSEYLRDAIVARLPALRRRSAVICNGVDTSRFRPRKSTALRRELEIADDEFVVGAVGRIIHGKGFDVLIRAAHRLRNHPVKFRYIIIGEKLADDDTDQYLAQLTRELSLERVIHILPFRDGIEEVFNNFDAYVLSSRTEGFSLTTVEAMACGLPVVATASGGPEEIVQADIDALLVPPENPDALADAMSRVAMDAALRGRLARQARTAAVRRFSLDTTVSRYEALYETLTGARPAAARHSA